MVDRLIDFQTLCNRHKSSLPPNSIPTGRPQKPRLNSGNQAFLTGSVYISKELDALSLQITKFAQDSQRRSLFEDTGVALAQASDHIKRKLESLTKGIQGLDRIVDSNQSKQQKEHYGTIVRTLKKKFQGLAKSFQENLEKRTKALTSRQAQQAKQFGASRVQLAAPEVNLFNPSASRTRRGYGGGGAQPPSPPSAGVQQTGTRTPPYSAPRGFPMNDASPGIRRRGNPGAGGTAPPPLPPSSMNNNVMPPAFNPYGASAPPTNEQSNQFGARQVAQYDRSSYAQRRKAIEMQHVEGMITEVSQMFGKMATLVAEQGEIVDRIDDNIVTSHVEVKAGQSELLKYYQNLSSERALILKIFATVICLGTFFILWL
mmetsp:Transcript_8794/g.14266  ORF Transcript_8794/g.14266 Transcript_8794/m.14266 type:complete len:373 (-) Transcript_8794:1295-2413(-)|eukprot:CAMPEP_0203755278 /NCGR_PEP_ID=MMETSP0098-20131031/8740_1 /ASSEMBLY_ACC=CAM_ASM_000208 /TAXON_ID=96639 /ORGANISM=" , Strain NY0313808BC1" /LENGTH=372 /DNA_ID=CAMNT_0050646661 /DNA_START=189 /DNA_END=1307 /DNA_ORIENTATION=+